MPGCRAELNQILVGSRAAETLFKVVARNITSAKSRSGFPKRLFAVC
jgi:hypothetical protein